MYTRTEPVGKMERRVESGVDGEVAQKGWEEEEEEEEEEGGGGEGEMMKTWSSTRHLVPPEKGTHGYIDSVPQDSASRLVLPNSPYCHAQLSSSHSVVRSLSAWPATSLTSIHLSCMLYIT